MNNPCRDYVPFGSRQGSAARLFRCLTVVLLAGAGTAHALHREQPHQATITFSDGRTVTGSVSLMGSRPLTITPAKGNNQRTIRLADIVRLEHTPEQSGMQRPWTFKEAGKPDKVYMKGEYPLLNFKTTVHLTNGTEISGHIISAVLRVQSNDRRRKIFLKRQIRGHVGETMDDISYVTEIRFPAARQETVHAIGGRIRGCGQLESATALDNRRGQIVTGRVTGNTFRFEPLLDGTYDLCLVTDRTVVLGISDRVPPGYAGGAPLKAGDVKAVNAMFPHADDFFNDRWIVRTAGNRAYTKALVYKRRAKYYAARKHTPGGWVWHLDVWIWHLAGDEWKIDNRHILARHKQQKDEAVRKLYFCKDLAAMKPGDTTAVQKPENTDTHEDWQFIRNLD